MNSLTLHGIEKAYNRGKAGEVVVLRGARLNVAAGEVVAQRGQCRIAQLAEVSPQDQVDEPLPLEHTHGLWMNISPPVGLHQVGRYGYRRDSKVRCFGFQWKTP